MEYVLDIPEALDHALRAQAQAEGKSVYQVAVEALEQRAAMPPVKYRDLSFFGSMSEEDADAISNATTFLDQCGVMSRDDQ
jgi:hypothetical protein